MHIEDMDEYKKLNSERKQNVILEHKRQLSKVCVRCGHDKAWHYDKKCHYEGYGERGGCFGVCERVISLWIKSKCKCEKFVATGA